MTDNEIIGYSIIGFFVFIFIMKFLTTTDNDGGNQINVNNYTNTNNSEKTNKYKKLEKEKINLETLKIKRDEYLNEVETLKVESSMNFEKEAINDTKIRKIEIQIRQINIKINEKEDEINKISYEIQCMN